MFLLAIAFHFSSCIQLVQHMLILVVPHIWYCSVSENKINCFLQYLLEIKRGDEIGRMGKEGFKCPLS